MPALSTTLDLFSCAASPMSTSSGKNMRQSGGSVDSNVRTNTQDVRADGTVVHERVIAFLRGRHPAWTAKRVGAETGISPATITKWLDRGSAPSGGHLLRLGLVYRTKFIAAVYLEVDAIEAAAQAEELQALKARVANLEHRGAR